MPRKIQTSILLEKSELELLDKAAEETGKSKSRLIREALSKFFEEIGDEHGS